MLEEIKDHKVFRYLVKPLASMVFAPITIFQFVYGLSKLNGDGK